MRGLLLLITAWLVGGCGCGETGLRGVADAGEDTPSDTVTDTVADPDVDPEPDLHLDPEPEPIGDTSEEEPSVAAECGNGIIEAGEECDDANTIVWDGCDECTITEFQVNTTTSARQEIPAVAMASDGRFIITWQTVFDTLEKDIFGRLYNIAGQPVGSEFQVNSYTDSVQEYAAVSMDALGRSAIAWSSAYQDGSAFGVFAQRYDATGALDGTEFQVNTFTMRSQYFSAVAFTPAGASIISWQSDWQDGDESGIFCQRYDSSGSADGTEFRVNTFWRDFQILPAVSVAGDGRFVIVWDSKNQDGDGRGIFAQRFNAAGSPIGSEIMVNSYTADDQLGPDVAMASDGSFVVVWSSRGQDGDDYGIFAQRYGVSGEPDGTEFQVNTYTTDSQQGPAVAVANGGQFLVVWTSSNQDGDDYGVFAQLYDARGTRIGTEYQVNTCIAKRQGSADVAMSADGRFIIVWMSQEQDGDDYGIFAQRYDATGNPLGTLPW